jgi:hypothetical protein
MDTMPMPCRVIIIIIPSIRGRRAWRQNLRAVNIGILQLNRVGQNPFDRRIFNNDRWWLYHLELPRRGEPRQVCTLGQASET